MNPDTADTLKVLASTAIAGFALYAWFVLGFCL